MNLTDALTKNPEAGLQFLRRYLKTADRTTPMYPRIAAYVAAQETKTSRPITRPAYLDLLTSRPKDAQP